MSDKIKMIAFDVYKENKKYYTTVWYDESFTEKRVKKSLIEHDNYNPNIKVICRAPIVFR